MAGASECEVRGWEMHWRTPALLVCGYKSFAPEAPRCEQLGESQGTI